MNDPTTIDEDRLRAAAPQLLAACQMLVDYGEHKECVVRWHWLNDCYNAAVRAVCAATGEELLPDESEEP